MKKTLLITSIFLNMIALSNEWELDTYATYTHKFENTSISQISFKQTPILNIGSKLKYSPDDINLNWYLDIHNDTLDATFKNNKWADYQLKTGLDYESHDLGKGFKLNTSFDIGIYDKAFTGTTDITIGFKHTTKNNFETSLKTIYNAISFITPLKIGAEFKIQQNFEKGNIYTVLKPVFNIKKILNDIKADKDLVPLYVNTDFNIGGKFNNDLLTYSPRVETTTDIIYKAKEDKYSINITPSFKITPLDIVIKPVNGLELSLSNTTTLNYSFNKEMVEQDITSKFQNVLNEIKFDIKYIAKVHSTVTLTPNIGFKSLLEYRNRDFFTEIKSVNDLKYNTTNYLFVTKETANIGFKIDYKPNDTLSLFTKLGMNTIFNVNHTKDNKTKFQFVGMTPEVNVGINLYW